SCNLDIPEPPSGETFDKTKVRVTFTSGSQTRELRYASDCAGSDAWHYDDPATPTQIVLCPGTCDVVQAEETAKLNVAFECEQVIVVPL
ncbi:MAG: VWA domain-containing protein, partial [Polyangiales bacterium]